MLISVQFPFADSRKFLVNSGQLSFPEWPLPVPDTQFVRHFGSIRLRRLGGIEGWVGENEICEANRALRFCGDLSFIDHDSPFRLLLRCAFRRLYFDGWGAGKFEVGIAPKKNGELNLSRDNSRNLISHILRFPVQVRNPSGDVCSCELINAGRHLAHSYLGASTAHNIAINPQDWWIRPGTPLVFLHYDEQEHIQLPYWARPIRLAKQSKFQLLQCQVPYNRGANVRMWVLGPALTSSIGRSFSRYNEERALRVCLLRLHAEHECLRIILRNIQMMSISITPRSREADNLQHYLNNATARIGKLEAESVRQFDTEIVDLARESMDLLSPGQRNALLNTLESLDIRKNVFHKVSKYADQWAKATVTIMEVQQMGDTYSVSGQAGAVGPNAHAHDMTFTQITTQAGDTIDLPSLARELSVLRTEMKKKAVEPEEDAAVGAIAEAETEAKNGHAPKMLEFLAKAGKWALEIATQIGTPLAIAAIKASLNIP